MKAKVRKMKRLLFLALCLITAPLLMATTLAPANAGRGVVALKAQSKGIFISWRMLPGDDDGTTFDVLRDGVTVVSGLSRATCYTDTEGSQDNIYQIVTRQDGEAVGTTEGIRPWADIYTTLRLDRPTGGVTPSGEAYRYKPDDCAVADVDGDGQPELLMKWDPTNSKDNETTGYTGEVVLDCYKLTGGRMWRICMGKNIRAGAHYTQMVFYDLNGDGRAELVCKTAPGTIDGTGRYVTEAATEDAIKAYDNSTDYRNTAGLSGRIMKGPELLTVFEGTTGKAIHTVYYNPNRAGSVGGEARYPTTSFWGDDYANRSERYLACVAYLGGQGENPSAVFTRGYYTRAYLWAVDFDGDRLKTRWLHASTDAETVVLTDSEGNSRTLTYTTHTAPQGRLGNTCYGEGAHNISVGDVDGDGCDEIMFGAAAVDHDGQMLYSTGLGHGDAIHLGDFDPDRDGLEFYMVQEDDPYGWHLRDAATGAIIVRQSGSDDTGMGTIADLDGRWRGYEFWSSDKLEMYGISGEKVADITYRGGVNMPHKHPIFWDGDVQQELYYDATVDKWNAQGGLDHVIQFHLYGNSTATGGKPHACIFGDLMGDWREEVILWDSSDSCTLNIFTTNIPTQVRVPWLMTDHLYEMGITWQNVGYNMPPHLSYYLPDLVATDNDKDKVTSVYDFTGISKGKTDLVTPTWGKTVTVDGIELDMLASADNNYDDRFAAERNEKNDSWRFRDVDATWKGLWAAAEGMRFAVLGISNGDEVTFTLSKGGLLTVADPSTTGGVGTIEMGVTPVSIDTDNGKTDLLLSCGPSTYIESISIATACGIKEIGKDTAGGKCGGWYTLQGVKVDAPRKGLYIHNGRKVVVK